MKLLDEKTVAPMVGKSVAWLQRKRWEGWGVPYRKIVRSIRYVEDEVLQWLDENAHKCTSTSEYKDIK